jgi:chaperone BCS1
MTTNHPENLDTALIRPGRVDHQVAFSSATTLQTKELFERMYADDLPRSSPKSLITTTTSKSPVPNVPSSSKANGNLTPPSTPTKPSSPSPSLTSPRPTPTTITLAISPTELSNLATAFAAKIPPSTFSPAEIQGFLLKRKTDPRRAVLEVEAWVGGMGEKGWEKRG